MKVALRPTAAGARRKRAADSFQRPAGIHRWELLALLLLLLIFVVVGLLAIARGAPLGHDESVYALRARDLARWRGPRGTYWGDLRAPGLPLVLAPLIALGATETVLRVVVLLVGAAGVVATWHLGRELISPAVGVLAAGLLALTPVYVSSSTLVHPDVPGAVLSLVAVALYQDSFTRRRSLAWLAVLTAIAATYVRYGAPLGLAVGFAFVALANFRALRSRVLHDAAVATVLGIGVLAVLFVPSLTGSTTAPYVATQEFNQSRYVWGQAFRDFAQQLPTGLSWVVGIASVVGLVGLAVATLRRDQSRAGGLAALGTAVTGLVLLGLTLNHGEPRYLVPVLPFLAIAAAGGIVGLSTWRRTAPAALGAIAGAAIIIAIPAAFLQSQALLESLQRAQTVRAAAQELTSMTDEGCWVLTGYVPETQWYSGCLASRFDLEEGVTLRSLDPDVPAKDPLWIMLVEAGKRQPEGEVLDSYLAQVDGPVIVTGDLESSEREGNVRIYAEDR